MSAAEQQMVKDTPHQTGAFHGIKRFLARNYLRLSHRSQSLIKQCDILSDDPFTAGLVPNDEDAQLEQPRQLKDENAVDGATIFGRDANDNLVYVRIDRFHDYPMHAEVYVRLSGDEPLCYRLLPSSAPGHSCSSCRQHVQQFSCRGLVMEVMEPLRRWKITFDGLLTRGDNEDAGNLIHVKFAFMWMPIHQPFDSKFFFNADLLSEAIAREKWTMDLWRKVKNPSVDWYDQWGCMIGTVEVGDGDTKVLRLRGKKTREFGVIEFPSLSGYISFDIYIEDGTVAYLKAESRTDTLSNCQSGYVIHCSDAYEAIVATDLSLLTLANDGVFPRTFELNIKTDKTKYLMKMGLLDELGFATYFGPKREIKTSLQTFQVTLGTLNGWALVQSGNRNKDSVQLDAVKETHPTTPLPTHFVIDDCPSLLVTPLTSEYCRSGNVVGGKGLGLALMTSLQADVKKFSVPRGVCVTVQCYWRHLDQNPNVKEALEVVRDVAWKRVEGDLKKECERLTRIFQSTDLSLATQEAITNELKSVFGDSLDAISFAVRSSAIGEDDNETSCAGQNETFLGVKGLTKIWKAIVDCWASQFSYVAIEYKRQNGQLLDRGMGVVIQEMVASDVAGVLFTADPVTGSTGTMMITANNGLGQSVVSSSVDPDTIVLNRNLDNSWSIREKSLGTKSTKDVLNAEGGVDSIASSNEESDRCCLSDAQILLLGEVGLMLEEMLGHGKPQDIEWALSDSRLYLLQSRAVTSINQDSDFMIAHEFDSGLLTDTEPLTTANVGEVLPGSLPPLTLSMNLAFFDIIFKVRFYNFRKEICRNIYGGCMMHVTQGHILGNFVNATLCGTMKTITPMLKASSYAMLGKDIMSGVLHETLLHRYGIMDSKGSWVLSKPGFQYIFSGHRAERRALKYMEASYVHVGPNETPWEFFNRLRRILRPLIKSMWVLMRGSTYSGMCGAIVLAVLLHDQTEVTNELMCDYALLLGGGNDVISASIPKTLKTLAQKINPEDFLSMNIQEAAEWLKNNTEEPGEIYRDLLKQHGHRCFREFDLMQRGWSEDPTPIIHMLQSSLRAPSNTHTTNKDLTIEESIAKVNTPLSNTQKMLLRRILPFCRNSVGARETGKSICIKGIDIYRKGYRALAKLMVAHGFLPEEDLLYFLTIYEIGQLLNSRSPRLINRAKRRRSLYPMMDKLRFPDFVLGYPEPECNEEQVPRDNNVGVSIKATTACQGCVRAKVRVVVHIEHAHLIQAGEILITHGTDIGWTPYFPLLSGIVTEIGGILSHGSVIAREYGLPCLIAADNATKLFRSGDEVILDASKGVIQLINNN